MQIVGEYKMGEGIWFELKNGERERENMHIGKREGSECRH